MCVLVGVLGEHKVRARAADTVCVGVCAMTRYVGGSPTPTVNRARARARAHREHQIKQRRVPQVAAVEEARVD